MFNWAILHKIRQTIPDRPPIYVTIQETTQTLQKINETSHKRQKVKSETLAKISQFNHEISITTHLRLMSAYRIEQEITQTVMQHKTITQ